MSSDIKKTIKINPEIFNVGNGTRKNREKKQKPTVAPLISPNILKNKLLKRIKEHKQGETENLDSKNGTNINDITKPQLVDKYDISKYTDEFNDSIEYLQSLSNQKKKEMDKINLEKRKSILHNKSIRNPNNFQSPHVELELPEDLKVSYKPEQIPNNFNNSIVTEPSTIKLNYKVDNVVPYGCLKGGFKPTYRDLNKTHRNYEISEPTAALTIQNTNMDKNKLEREKRLNLLRAKIKTQTQPEIVSTSQPIIENIIQQPSNIYIQPNNNISQPNNIPQLNNIQQSNNNIPQQNIDNTNYIEEPNHSPQQKYIKKTIRQKYTLGKSKIGKSVGVLIKDKHTRKRIINAQRDLKKQNINDVKTYLRKHNLIKIGSNAPNDVIRKLYESSMLSGEITNNNKDTLLHNFIKDTSE
jgi:hypothetical protein